MKDGDHLPGDLQPTGPVPQEPSGFFDDRMHTRFPVHAPMLDDAPVGREAGAKDGIDRPSHYARFPIEPVTYIMLNNLPFWAGNVVKYVSRAPYKESEERDLIKARRYIDMRLEQLRREREGVTDVVWNPL